MTETVRHPGGPLQFVFTLLNASNNTVLPSPATTTGRSPFQFMWATGTFLSFLAASMEGD